jgi:hypothetical protein
MSRIRNVMRCVLRVPRFLFGPGFLIFGVAGIPDDLSTWGKWLRQLSPYLDSVQDWQFVVIGVILISMNIAPYGRAALCFLRKHPGSFEIDPLQNITLGDPWGAYLYLQIKNLGPTALDVRTELTFRNSSGELVAGPVRGVWFLEKGRPGLPAEFLDSKPAHIHHDESRRLAIAMKCEDDDEGYALCEHSIGFRDWKNPKLHLSVPFRLELEILGSNFRPYTFKSELSLPGVPPQVRRADPVLLAGGVGGVEREDIPTRVGAGSDTHPAQSCTGCYGTLGV